MKRVVFVILIAVGVAALSCGLYYQWQMARAVPPDEMQWLKREFALSDAQLAKIEQLQRDYRPVCDGHCLAYLNAHDRVVALLSRGGAWNSELESAVTEMHRVEMECHRDMLKHAYDVAAVMSPEQGRSYLTMIREKLALTAPQEMRRATR